MVIETGDVFRVTRPWRPLGKAIPTPVHTMEQWRALDQWITAEKNAQWWHDDWLRCRPAIRSARLTLDYLSHMNGAAIQLIRARVRCLRAGVLIT